MAVEQREGEVRRMNRMQQWVAHVSNQRTSFAFGFLIIGVHLGLVIQRIYQYQHASACVIIARAAGKHCKLQKTTKKIDLKSRNFDLTIINLINIYN